MIARMRFKSVSASDTRSSLVRWTANKLSSPVMPGSSAPSSFSLIASACQQRVGLGTTVLATIDKRQILEKSRNVWVFRTTHLLFDRKSTDKQRLSLSLAPRFGEHNVQPAARSIAPVP